MTQPFLGPCPPCLTFACKAPSSSDLFPSYCCLFINTALLPLTLPRPHSKIISTKALPPPPPPPPSSSSFSAARVLCFCMAFSLLAHEVSDLCLGKPALRSLSVSATVGEALSALKTSEDSFISVWSCDHSAKNIEDECRCVGKICMVDVVCFLCKDENLLSPSSALKSPVSDLLPTTQSLVTHVEPHSRYDSAPSPIIIITSALLLGFKFVIKLKRSNRILKEPAKILFLCLNCFFFSVYWKQST